MVKYRVAIVEDNPGEAAILETHFRNYGAAHKIAFELQRFSDGGELLFNYQPVYDLVMMDVNLPLINGIDASISLRSIDTSVTLVLVTSMLQYAVKGYEVEAQDFLLKPVSYQLFCMKMDHVMQHVSRRVEGNLLIAVQDGLQRISISQIKYVEVINHSLIYHTTKGNMTTSGRLSDAEEKIGSSSFIRCNRCYLINLAFVRSINGMEITVDTDVLQISRPKRAYVLEALNNYLGGGVT